MKLLVKVVDVRVDGWGDNLLRVTTEAPAGGPRGRIVVPNTKTARRTYFVGRLIELTVSAKAAT